MRARIGVAAVAGLLLLSCPKSPSGSRCTIDADCEAGQSCLASTCVACPVCAAGEVCMRGGCLPSKCGDYVCPTGQACQSTSGRCASADCLAVQCAVDHACAGGKCYPKDCASQACVATDVCLQSSCVVSACVGVVCPTGQDCANGQCVEQSCQGVVCAAGAVCERGACANKRCVGVICPDQTLCQDGKCVPVACDAKSCAQGQVCVSGSCVAASCSGVACNAGNYCDHDKCMQCNLTEAGCSDGLDDDCDGLTDCADADCAASADCSCGGVVCTAPRRCIDSHCLEGSCGDRACPANQGCQNGICAGAECVSVICDAGSACVGGSCYTLGCGAAGCDPGEVCASGKCTPAACVDQTCGADQVCADGQCVLKDCAGATCADGAACVNGHCLPLSCAGLTCPSGQLCVQGACQPTSCGSTPCPAGQACVQGSCVDAACAGVTCPAAVCKQGECKACEATETDCTNGADDDCNGRTDCDDLACGGLPCTPPQACALPGTCVSGKCTSPTPKPSSEVCRAAVDACDAPESCDGTSLGCPADAFAAKGATCPDEGNACTSDTCDGKGACQHTPVADNTPCGTGQTCQSGSCGTGCTIGGTHYATDAPNPTNPCQLCDPVKSASAWSNQPQATSCPDEPNACTTDACDAAGACQHTPVADNTPCGTGQTCQSGSCGTGCTVGGTHYASNAPNPTNPCQLCDPARDATAWSSLPTGTACPDDANTCTTDSCDASGTCTHPAKPDGTNCGVGQTCQSGSCGTGCVIGGTHYATDALNPANACQSCDPLKNTGAWSNLASSTSCPDDGNLCTTDACNGAGTCTHTTVVDGTSCGATQVCSAGACKAGCYIAGSYYATAALNPANPCQSCDPTKSKAAWSNLGSGTSCPDDNNACTTDTCDASGTCQHPALPNGTSCGAGLTCQSGACGTGCDIASQHYAPNAPNPGNPCQLCDPSKSTSAWSSAASGTGCPDDGNLCTSDACDGTGTCQHPALGDGTSCGATKVCSGAICKDGCYIGTSYYTTSTLNPGNACQSCDPTKSKSGWSNLGSGTACPDDGNACTSDACNGSGVCQHAPIGDGSSCGATKVCSGGTCQDGCYISGFFRATNTLNPGNACQSCAPAKSKSAWSDLAAGTSCPDDGNGCTTDTCNGSGICQHPALGDGTSCGSGQVCQGGTCKAGCWISAYYTTSAPNPGNACQDCEPSKSTTAWSNVGNGTNCNDGNACTQTDTCQSGACTGSNPVVCTASDQCHDVGTCNTSTGVCSNPPKTNGTGCNDGNACTLTDTCQSGACTGSNPVVCTASDQCHVAGTCNSSTGLCSNPPAGDGLPCNTGAQNCNQTCSGGVCQGGALMVTCYRDADGDGYGAGSGVGQCGGCTTGWVTDNTDCYDGNSNAHPGQTGYYQTNRGDGSFDYNCDASETSDVLFSQVSSMASYCGAYNPPNCPASPPTGNAGWVGSMPACGTSATWNPPACIYGTPCQPISQLITRLCH